MDMDIKNKYSNEMTAHYPSNPKGFDVAKDHFDIWFFNSLKN